MGLVKNSTRSFNANQINQVINWCGDWERLPGKQWSWYPLVHQSDHFTPIGRSVLVTRQRRYVTVYTTVLGGPLWPRGPNEDGNFLPSQLTASCFWWGSYVSHYRETAAHRLHLFADWTNNSTFFFFSQNFCLKVDWMQLFMYYEWRQANICFGINNVIWPHGC